MTSRSLTFAAVVAVTGSFAFAQGGSLATAGTAPAEAAAAAPAPAAPAPQLALYDRLGGVYAIAVVVDAFIERLLVNETLNANPAIDAARHRVPRQGLKFHVTTLLCQATGGPCSYVGRDMQTAHAHLGITEAEWQAMRDDLAATLESFAVPAAEREELFALVEGTKGAIVVADQAAAHR